MTASDVKTLATSRTALAVLAIPVVAGIGVAVALGV